MLNSGAGNCYSSTESSERGRFLLLEDVDEEDELASILTFDDGNDDDGFASILTLDDGPFSTLIFFCGGSLDEEDENDAEVDDATDGLTSV